MNRKRPNRGPKRATPSARLRAQAASRLADSDFAVVALGSREVLRLRPTWDRVVERLQLYGLGQVLDILGRISIVLNRLSEPALEMEGQVRLLAGIFGLDSDVHRGLAAWIDREVKELGRATPWVLFHERQVINAVKIAFLSLPVDDRPGVDDLRPLGEALLMISNLIEAEWDKAVEHGPRTELRAREWEQLLFTNLLSGSDAVEIHAIARGHLLFHVDRSHLESRSGSYVDLPEHLEQITGVSPSSLQMFLRGLNARWFAAELDEVRWRTSSLDPYRFFEGSGIFTRSEVDGLLHLVGEDAGVLQAEIKAAYSLSAIRPYSVLPLARRPMVLINGHAYIPSVGLLKEKLVRGTHHHFLDPALVPDAKMRRRYLDFLGHVFEDYVSDTFARAYRSAIGTFIPEKTLKPYISGKLCDGIIHVGDTLVLIEAKAKLFPLGVREGTDWDSYLVKATDVFLGSARQINAMVAAVKAGALRDCGVNPREIRAFLPLVVTLEDSAMNHLLYERITQMVRAEGLLGDTRVLPIQIIDVGEMETWETGLSVGKPMHRRLEEKASSEETVHMTFGNFLIRRGDEFLNRKNPYLLSVYEALTDQILDEMRARQERSGIGNPRGVA